MERETGSKVTYPENLSQLVERQKELGVQQSHLPEAEAALAAVIETRQQAVEEYRRTWLGELATAEAKAAGLAQDVVKASEKSRLQVLCAPVDGTVQQLAVHTVGGVVTPAQALLEVVPLDSRLEIEAVVQDRDIGFVRAGQEAESTPLISPNTASCTAPCLTSRRTRSNTASPRPILPIRRAPRGPTAPASRSGAIWSMPPTSPSTAPRWRGCAALARHGGDR